MSNFIKLSETLLSIISILLASIDGELLEADVDSAFLSGQRCEELLMDYATLTANFTKCFIQHARPITVCQNCIDNYVQVVESYTNITKLKDVNTGIACKLMLINVDRLEVIERSYEYVRVEWKRAFCSRCFNGNSTELNSKTKEILALQDVTQTCIREKQDNHNNTICNSSSTVCADCVDKYRRLNDFYDLNKSYNGFCMDITDMMNMTRYNWSSILCCCSDRRKPEPIYLFVYSGVFLIPVIFYLVIWHRSTAAFQNITYHSRLSQRYGNRLSEESTR